MITYKILNNESEITKVAELCEKHKLKPKFAGLTILALDGEELVGMINLANVPSIELFISDNSLVANNLFRQVEGYLITQGSSVVRCNPTPNLEKIYKKVGFEKKLEDKIVMEKYYG